jgi:hypothetical protein
MCKLVFNLLACFGLHISPIFKVQEVRPIGCPKMLVTNYKQILHNIPEQQSTPQRKSQIVQVSIKQASRTCNQNFFLIVSTTTNYKSKCHNPQRYNQIKIINLRYYVDEAKIISFMVHMICFIEYIHLLRCLH